VKRGLDLSALFVMCRGRNNAVNDGNSEAEMGCPPLALVSRDAERKDVG
jgi:hypothetical protein